MFACNVKSTNNVLLTCFLKADKTKFNIILFLLDHINGENTFLSHDLSV